MPQLVALCLLLFSVTLLWGAYGNLFRLVVRFSGATGLFWYNSKCWRLQIQCKAFRQHDSPTFFLWILECWSRFVNTEQRQLAGEGRATNTHGSRRSTGVQRARKRVIWKKIKFWQSCQFFAEFHAECGSDLSLCINVAISLCITVEIRIG